MKKVIYLVSALILVSCAPTVVDKKEDSFSDKPLKEIFNGVDYQVVVIDSCEYIIGRDDNPYNGGYFLSHKGNCNNPIHKK